MKLKDMVNYNLKQNKGLLIGSVIAFWALNLILIIIKFACKDTSELKLCFYDVVTIIFFVVGCSYAGQRIYIGLANGISRKTMFVSNIISAVIYALVVAVVIAISNIALSNIDGVYSYGEYYGNFATTTHYYVYDKQTDEQLAEISESEYDEQGIEEKMQEKYGVKVYVDGDNKFNNIQDLKGFNKNTVFDILLMFVGNISVFAGGWILGALFAIMNKAAKLILIAGCWIGGAALGIVMGILDGAGVDFFETSFGKLVFNILELAGKISNWVHENFAHMMTWEVIVCVVAIAIAFIPTFFIKPKKQEAII